VLGVPTDLPEGTVVELVPLDEVLARGGDWLGDEERAELHKSLEESEAQAERGETVDARAFLEELRRKR
jgi:hypothetical protein